MAALANVPALTGAAVVRIGRTSDGPPPPRGAGVSRAALTAQTYM
ncbi:hypothetical protein WME99_07265 [Sorangium sp. So ce136]